MANQLDLKEFLAGFLVEAEEHLSASNQNLLSADQALKKGQVPARQVRDLFRSLHTLKGLAAMVGLDPIVDLAHQMESVLREADRAGGKLPEGSVDVLLQGTRAIEERVNLLSRGAPLPPAPRALVDALAALRETERRTEAAHHAGTITLDPELLARLSAGEQTELAQGLSGGERAVRLDFVPTPERMAKGLNITAVRERLAPIAEIVKVIPRSQKSNAEAPAGLTFALLLLTKATNAEIAEATGLPEDEVQEIQLFAPAPEGQPEEAAPVELPTFEEMAEPAVHRRSLVRVDVSRLDDALEKLSALVVTRHKLTRVTSGLAERGADVRELSVALNDATRQLRDLRSSIMAARMVPVSEILDRVPLIVRGLSKTTGKPVRLELSLGSAELDKSVGERLFPAIVHLLRNAVDHGIEEPAERERLGKPAEGVLTVSGHPRSNSQLELHVSDDGRGVNAAELARKANVPVPTDMPGLLALLTRPGLSSRSDVTHTSGRGMGMDIVQKIVEEQLGGQMELRTEAGRGTTFVLRVPLSVTIIDAFTFQVGDQRFAVPVSVVEEIVEVEPGRLIDSPAPDRAAGAHRMLERRGEAMTFLALGSVFGMTQAANEARKALVIRRNGEALAFGVSRMLGQQEIVVRRLEDPLLKVSGVSGATDLGDGRPTLVLDLAALSGARGSQGANDS